MLRELTSMRTTKATTSKPVACERCAGTELVRRISTYPVVIPVPGEQKAKEVHVNRVALYQCQSCGHLMPTPAGQAKVDRLILTVLSLWPGTSR